MKILGVDPGGTTGIALWYGGDFRAEECDDPMMALLGLDFALDKMSAEDGDEVVCENFVPRPGVRSWQPDALHIIGALRYLCWRSHIPLSLPMPTNKTFATDDRLRKAGMWTPGKGHANDAARHLLQRLVRLKQVNLEDIL